MNIYSKYLIKKKRKYFLLYRSKVSTISSKTCACQCSNQHPNIHKIYGSIPLNRDSFQRKMIYNYSEKNINFNKNYSISPKTSNSNIKRQSLSINGVDQNKSAYDNYIIIKNHLECEKDNILYNGGEDILN